MTPEEKRLDESHQRTRHWKRWGPYVAERQWGTVREDYSPHGTAWEYFPHDHARSRAYRWGKMGLGGSATVTSGFVSRWRFGTGAIRSLKSVCSASQEMKAIMAKM